MAINSLLDIYKKKGKDFVEKLFHSKVTINEKINGFSFYVEKNLDGTFIFYKKEQDNPISLVDRTLMNYYESPIAYFNSLSHEVKEKIPYRWKFGFDYLPTKDPLTIIYDRIPKNGLILSCIIEKDQYGNFIRQVNNKTDLDSYADLLGVSRFPIIFQGSLTEEQKMAVMEVVSSGIKTLNEIYHTDSVIKAIIGILNPEMSSTALNDSLDKSIEGIIFRFDDAEGDSVLAKMIDPVFSELIKERDKSGAFLPNDTYSLTLLDVMFFILYNGVERFSKEGTSAHERYLNFICDVFNKLMEESEEKYRGLDFREPEFLRSDFMKTNMAHIASEQTLKYLKEDESFDSLFRIILSAFRKYKRKTNSLFTEGVIAQFNTLIDDISDYLNEANPVYEATLPTFGQFRKNIEKFTPDEESAPEEETIETPEGLGDEEIAQAEAEEEAEEISELPDRNESEAGSFLEDPAEERFKARPKVNLVIVRSLPIKNSDLKRIIRTHKENQMPCVCVVIRSSHKKDNLFSLELSKKALSAFVGGNNETVGYAFAYYPTLTAFIDCVLEKFHPVSIVTDTDELHEAMNLQYNWIKEEYEGRIAEDFKIYKALGSTNEDPIMHEILGTENFSEFKKISTKEMVIFFPQFVSEYLGKDAEKKDI